jgi:hypothetical protein
MKPMIFKTEADLINFIASLPRNDRAVKVKGMFDDNLVNADAILAEITLLVPRMFSLRALMVKGLNGIGNYKSLERFMEVASNNIAQEKIAAYEEALQVVATEVDALIDGGLNEEIAEKLQSAKSSIAALTMIKETVHAFEGRLLSVANRVTSKYGELATTLNKAKLKQDSQEAKTAVATAAQEFLKTHGTMVELVADLKKFCLLQISYNSTLLS